MAAIETHTYDWAPDYIRVSRDPHAHTRIKTDSHTSVPAVQVELEFTDYQTEQVLTIWAEQPLGDGLSHLTIPARWLPALLQQVRERMPMIDATDEQWHDAIYGINA